MRINWTPERIEELRRLADGNANAGQIATILNVTRNTVVGKCRRAKITLHGAPVIKPDGPRKRRRSHKRRPLTLVLPGARHALTVPESKPAPIPNSYAAIDLANAPQGLSIFAIGRDQCRWPLNDVDPISQFRMCGKESCGSYCASHARRAYGRNTEFASGAAE